MGVKLENQVEAHRPASWNVCAAETREVEVKNQLLKVVLWPVHMDCGKSLCTQAHAHVHTDVHTCTHTHIKQISKEKAEMLIFNSFSYFES